MQFKYLLFINYKLEKIISILVKPFRSINNSSYYDAKVKIDSADFCYGEYTLSTAAVHTIYATDLSSSEKIIVGWLVPKEDIITSKLDFSTGDIKYSVTTLYELWNSEIAEENGLALYFERGISPQTFPNYSQEGQQIGLWNVNENREETGLSLVQWDDRGRRDYSISNDYYSAAWIEAYPNNLPPFLEDISAEWAKERAIYAPIKAKIKLTYNLPIEPYVYKIDWSDIKCYSTYVFSIPVLPKIDETSTQYFTVYASREDRENAQPPINYVAIDFKESQRIPDNKVHRVELNDGNKLDLSWATLCAIAEDAGVDLESELVLQADDNYMEVTIEPIE